MGIVAKFNNVANILPSHLIWRTEVFAQAKICQHNMPLGVEEDVFQFDVSIDNSQLLEKSTNNNFSCLFLVSCLNLFDMCIERQEKNMQAFEKL
jgi:hypothetical protein